jgi:hypothetical protein
VVRVSAGPVQAGAPWWAVLPPAEAEVACGEETHRLLWKDGGLTASDHPDAEGELVLAALGGERSECIDLVESWGSRDDDLEVLAVGPRSADDELTITTDEVAEMRGGGGWYAYAPLAMRHRGVAALRPRRLPRRVVGYGGFGPGAARRRAMMARRASASVVFSSSASHRTLGLGSGGSFRFTGHSSHQPHDEAERAAARRAELLSLLALGAEFQFRLCATVAAAWADGGSRAGERAAGRPALVAALTGRLAPAAQSWLGIDPGQVEADLHEGAGWGRLEMSRGGGLRGALSADWLASVWAAGLAVTGGHLIVEVREVAWPEATVLGVPEPGADPVILNVRADAGRWRAVTPEARR